MKHHKPAGSSSSNPFFAPFGRYRIFGGLATLTRSFEASRKPIHHWLLHWMGFLKRPTKDWPQAKVVESMPWGRRSAKDFHVEAPKPERPEGVEGPWPQAPVIHPLFSAPVLEIPPEDDADHIKFNVLRFIGQATTLWPMAAFRSVVEPRLKPLTDEIFEDLLQNTLYSQFIRPGLDSQDETDFSGVLEGPAENYYKIDFSALSTFEPIEEGLTAAPTVTLLRKRPDGTYQPLAIRARDRVILPTQANAWALARYFVLQAAAYQVVTIWHPRLHFPADALHAITRSMLPDGHPIKRLIEPHTKLTLGLHKGVIHHRRSVVHNNQREIYTPFGVTTGSIHRGIIAGTSGIPGNRGYPEFQWGDDLPGEHTGYGRYRKDWADAFQKLCESVLADIPAGDPLVSAWADHIASFVPGFPSSETIFEDNRLAWAVSVWMRGVTVFHTADHHSFGKIPLGWAPLRLRAPLPDPEKDEPLDLRSMVTREDYIRRTLAHEMFFKPSITFRLSDVRYDMLEGHPSEAVDTFWEEVQEIDARWADSHFPVSREIGASIQY